MAVLPKPTIIKSWTFDYDPGFEVFVPIIDANKPPIAITCDTRPLLFRTLALKNNPNVHPDISDGDCPPIERGPSTTGHPDSRRVWKHPDC
jgi:hypothetical protein